MSRIGAFVALGLLTACLWPSSSAAQSMPLPEKRVTMRAVFVIGEVAPAWRMEIKMALSQVRSVLKRHGASQPVTLSLAVAPSLDWQVGQVAAQQARQRDTFVVFPITDATLAALRSPDPAAAGFALIFGKKAYRPMQDELLRDAPPGFRVLDLDGPMPMGATVEGPSGWGAVTVGFAYDPFRYSGSSGAPLGVFFPGNVSLSYWDYREWLGDVRRLWSALGGASWGEPSWRIWVMNVADALADLAADCVDDNRLYEGARSDLNADLGWQPTSD